MERQKAIRKIQEIVGQDLGKLADKYNVTVFKECGMGDVVVIRGDVVD